MKRTVFSIILIAAIVLGTLSAAAEWDYDLNSDEIVDIADVSDLLNAISAGEDGDALDLNADGMVNIADVSALLDYLADPVLPAEGLLYRVSPDGDGYYVIGAGSFDGRILSIPSTYRGSPVTGIINGCFANNKKLTAAIIPRSVKMIGASAFSGCASLQTVRLPEGLTELPDGVFSGCGILCDVDLPQSLVSIGSEAFSGCARLNKLELPPALERIGDRAFKNCASLRALTVPATVTQIGLEPFYGCDMLTSLKVDVANNVYFDASCNAIFNDNCVLIAACNGTDLSDAPFAAAIGEKAFSGCRKLTKITIPEQITSFGTDAFADCFNLWLVTHNGYAIAPACGEDAYGGLAKYAKVILDVHGNAEFANDDLRFCGGLFLFDVSGDLPSLIAIFEDGSVTLPADCSGTPYTIDSCIGGETVKIPDTFTEINDCAFLNNTTIVDVLIPDTVETIGSDAFCSCRSLRYVHIPVGVRVISADAFERCDALEYITSYIGNEYYFANNNCLYERGSGKLVLGCKNSVIRESVGCTTIGAFAFVGCRDLTSLVLPDTVTEISTAAFNDCHKLKKINLESVLYIDDYAFADCFALEKLTFSPSLRCLGGYAFAVCSSLEELDFSAGIDDGIGPGAFYGCRNLKVLRIADNCDLIYENVCYGCASLTDVYYGGSADEFAGIVNEPNDDLKTANIHYAR